MKRRDILVNGGAAVSLSFLKGTQAMAQTGLHVPPRKTAINERLCNGPSVAVCSGTEFSLEWFSGPLRKLPTRYPNLNRS